jgi:hypothetical protein
MKRKLLPILILLLINTTINAQTAKNVHTFPEDYIGKTITYENIRYWPVLKEFNGYYTVQIDIAASLIEEREWGFQTMNKVIGVVEKNIAKQMINKEIGGYKSFYYGTIVGSVIKSNKIFGSEYLFVVTKIINYPPHEPESVIEQFE